MLVKEQDNILAQTEGRAEPKEESVECILVQGQDDVHPGGRAGPKENQQGGIQ